MDELHTWQPPAHLKQLESQLRDRECDDLWGDRDFVMLVWWACFGLTVHYATWAKVSLKLG
jgi:hypothetical protein